MSRPPEPQYPDAASADAASADVARRRLREQGIVRVEPDGRIGVMLAPGEDVITVRRAVAFERRTGVQNPAEALVGDVYVTTARLVCLGRVRVEVPLAEIREAVVSSGALLLVIGDGRGLEIRTGDPCLLRVEIAAVREAARGAKAQSCPSLDAAGTPPGTPAPDPAATGG
jgi:hypothetical protein